MEGRNGEVDLEICNKIGALLRRSTKRDAFSFTKYEIGTRPK